MCYKLQRMRGQNNRGRRLATTVQHNDSGVSFTDSSPAQSTRLQALTLEQYKQLITLLSKQNMEATPNLENPQSAAYLAGKSFCLLTTQPKMKWIVDSGATNHITPHISLFKSYVPILKTWFITMPNGRQVLVKNIGTLILNNSITLQDVLHVLDFQFSLLSESKLAKQLSSNVVFTPNSCYIQGPMRNN